MREHALTVDDLIYPVFVVEGKDIVQPVPSMPGVARHSIDRLLRVAEQALELGVPCLALFPGVDAALKTADGIEATNPDGLVPRTVQALKAAFPELGIMTDVALDPYTSHGQDGIIDDTGVIRHAAHLGWSDLPLAQRLTERFGNRRTAGLMLDRDFGLAGTIVPALPGLLRTPARRGRRRDSPGRGRLYRRRTPGSFRSGGG